MEQKEKEKKNVGRPRTSQMKSYHYKADGDLIPVLEKLDNKNLGYDPAKEAKSQTNTKKEK